MTTHLPADLARKLDDLAGELERPRGWLVKEAVEACVALAEERQRETQAQAGRLTDVAPVDSVGVGRRERR